MKNLYTLLLASVLLSSCVKDNEVGVVEGIYTNPFILGKRNFENTQDGYSYIISIDKNEVGLWAKPVGYECYIDPYQYIAVPVYAERKGDNLLVLSSDNSRRLLRLVSGGLELVDEQGNVSFYQEVGKFNKC